MTNYDPIEHLSQVQKYNKIEKRKTGVQQPNLIRSYNEGMVRVDLHDWLIGKHEIAIRGKMWYWCHKNDRYGHRK